MYTNDFQMKENVFFYIRFIVRKVYFRIVLLSFYTSISNIFFSFLFLLLISPKRRWKNVSKNLFIFIYVSSFKQTQNIYSASEKHHHQQQNERTNKGLNFFFIRIIFSCFNISLAQFYFPCVYLLYTQTAVLSVKMESFFPPVSLWMLFSIENVLQAEV